ncbi:phosphopyruvate hydratase [Candidatus Collierbacteria bacterium RIFOXYB2_FULL_46_14]|uniref:Enolase n=1 Tax=Candidatus Collierbacteria bacterium GW2011_GWA2_46_26 TaxID=1618381 RepID=A0A0G1SH90_9BACT|nr:MAG: Enolase [Candidatus Collierbacteria bacterium GW2011_GWC2_44_13]KKU32675.1 MAG: Enolase [Candidatus Collierbacteria bacterium GW2011_GWA2_46_26]OGD73249.1 MAG: phosphopyruvate hydratase [Candidatus Collierbacteria bacterium RIFOXYB2_FULL_46_14]OGD76291.1 MAG: phosphopyruvate hydratase [Candidatus Collierbacteria bacterium RIFOXYA2_FULL_46_20]OGD77627.1 MAG: phosphopyruvate hydratase [Candidatus Collierbacteria bacterium RIFOXYC2_FULL_43_15]OGD80917.1 MAG: phosphopyruvate hydratase [Pse
MSKIKSVYAREILDSRGNPTIETTIWSDSNHGAVASVPSGASTGRLEAFELRDGDPNRFDGMGVLKACASVNQIVSKYLIGLDPLKQNEIDQILINLDGTANKSKLGANAILSASQACFELGAACAQMPTFEYTTQKYGLATPSALHLPTPIFNMVNGGKHGAGNLDFQEYHCIPSSRKKFSDALEMGSELYHLLKKILTEKKAIHSVGDEGGFAPNLFSNTDAIELLVETIESSKYKLNEDVYLGLDVAASSFYDGGKYKISDVKESMSGTQMGDFLIDLVRKYSLLSVEDPFDQDAWTDWENFTNNIGKQLMVVGDDLLVTNRTRLEESIKRNACNTVLVKPNQIGTISETVSVVKLARKNDMSIIVSHRSGDTDEDFLADFAVGVGADFVKFGAPGRGERVTKYNRLLFIQEYLESLNPQ